MQLTKMAEKRLAQFFFVTTNKDIKMGAYRLKKGLDLPITDRAVSDLVAGDNGFDFKAIIANMCLIVGLDEQFVHRAQYINIISEVVKQPTDYCLSQGVDAANQENWIDAIGYFKAALQFDANSYDANFHLGRIYYQMYSEKVVSKAVLQSSYEALMSAKAQKDSPEVAYFLSYVCFHQQAFQEAFQQAKAALKKGLSGDLRDDLIINITIFEDRAKYQIGYRHILARRYQEGLEALLTVSEQGQDDWRLQFFSAVAYRGLGQLSTAIRHFAKARDLNPQNGDTYNDLGITYMMLNDFENAKAAFSAGLYKQPDNVELLCNMGIAHIHSKQYDLAAKFLEKADKMAPETAAVKAALQELRQRS